MGLDLVPVYIPNKTTIVLSTSSKQNNSSSGLEIKVVPTKVAISD